MVNPTDPYAALPQLIELAEVIVDAGKKATKCRDTKYLQNIDAKHESIRMRKESIFT